MKNGENQVSNLVTEAAWDKAASSDPNALIFQTRAWVEALCGTGKFLDISQFYETRDGRYWVLPLVKQKTFFPSLSMIGSFPPGWGHGGVVSPNRLYAEDYRVIFSSLLAMTTFQATLHINPLVANEWESTGPVPGIQRIPRTSHVLDLVEGFDVIWSNKFQPATRRAIRKAEKSNLTIEWDDTGKFLPIYYDIFMEWAARRGKERHLPAQLAMYSNSRREPFDRYKLIVDAFGKACRIYLVKHENQPVAAAIFLFYNQNAIYYRGASLREEANSVRANDLLHKQMIQDACNLECCYYHMGESGGVESLMRFKSGFGAQPVSSYDYAIERYPVSRISSQATKALKMIEQLAGN